MKRFWILSLLSAFSLTAAPTCNTGTDETWRAGERQTLNASASTGTGTLTFLWSQTGGPTTVLWPEGKMGATVDVEGLVFGEYSFQVVVSDSTGTTNCTVTRGAVAMDSNGVVVPDTSTPNKAKIHQLLGPIIARGRNPWQYADVMADQTADIIDGCWDQDAIGGNCGTGIANNHIPRTKESEWEPGTISLTVGSTAVTCTDDVRGSCQLKTTFCGGGSSFITGAYLYVKYPVADTDPQEYGWKRLTPSTCASETSMTLSASTPYVNTGFSNGTVQSGLFFSS
jgi:hypothetical protein